MAWTPTALGRLDEVVRQITFNDWRIILSATGTRDGGTPTDVSLRVKARATCNVSGGAYEWSGRKWPLSSHMTEGEIVQTAFLAVMTAVEHETREQFKYMGQSIFDPHYDVRKLVELRASADALIHRDESTFKQKETKP